MCRIHKLEVLIIFTFIATSGFPSFLSFKPFICLFIPFLLYKLHRDGRQIPPNAQTAIGVIILFSAIHLILGHLTLIGAISLILELGTIILSGFIIGNNFEYIYIKLIKFLSYIAVGVWGLILILPPAYSILYACGEMLPQFISDSWIENTSNSGISLYLYYLPKATSTAYTSFIRNSGPFYEPGLFASYLSIALILNLNRNKSLLSKENWILIFAILTTCSSAGYVSFALIVLYSVFFSKRIIMRIIVFSSILFLWEPIMNLDFMANKIAANYNKSTSSTASRFGAIVYHYEKIEKSPIWGYAGGQLPDTSFDRLIGKTSTQRMLSPNGLTYPFVFWGIPLTLIFYLLLFRSIKRITNNGSGSRIGLYFIFVIILSTAFSQTITTEFLILLLASLGLFKQGYEANKIENRSCTHL